MQKKTILVASIASLFLYACMPEEEASSPSPSTSRSSRSGTQCSARKSVTKSAPTPAGKVRIDKLIVMAIRPDSSGCMVDCKFSSAVDPQTQREVDFSPGPGFLGDACDNFSRAKWKVMRDKQGSIKDVYYPCFYSEQLGDHAICEEM